MDIAVLAVNSIAMLAGVISAVIAVKAKNETQEMIFNFKKHNELSQTSGNNQNINEGTNNGVISQSVTGGVKIGTK